MVKKQPDEYEALTDEQLINAYAQNIRKQVEIRDEKDRLHKDILALSGQEVELQRHQMNIQKAMVVRGASRMK